MYQTLTTLCSTAVLLAASTWASGQRTRTEPVTESSAQASPATGSGSVKAEATDASMQASPVTDKRRGSFRLPANALLPVRLSQAVDSGKLKNGQTVSATLAAPCNVVGRAPLPAGTPVLLTVVATLPAGAIYAAGEFSLQLVSVGGVPVETDTQTFRGHPGRKDLPDSAPELGMNAGLPAGAALTFHVLPPPTMNARKPGQSGGETPGSVTGISNGEKPSEDVAKRWEQRRNAAAVGSAAGPAAQGAGAAGQGTTGQGAATQSSGAQR